MLVASFIFSTLALIFGLLTYPFVITLPVCILVALIGLVFAIIYYIKKHDGEDRILNFLPIVYSGIVIVALSSIFIVLFE